VIHPAKPQKFEVSSQVLERSSSRSWGRPHCCVQLRHIGKASPASGARIRLAMRIESATTHTRWAKKSLAAGRAARLTTTSDS